MKTKAERCGGCGGKIRYTDASYHYLGKPHCRDCFMKPVRAKQNVYLSCMKCGSEAEKHSNYCSTCNPYNKPKDNDPPKEEGQYDFENDPPEAYSWIEDAEDK